MRHNILLTRAQARLKSLAKARKPFKKPEQRTITVCGQQVQQMKCGDTWFAMNVAPIVTNEPAIVPFNAVQAFSRKFPQRAPMQLIKEGGHRKLRRKSEYGKSLRKFYGDLEKAASLRIIHSNRKVNCEQVFGEFTNTQLPHEIAIAALGAALRTMSNNVETQASFFNRSER